MARRTSTYAQIQREFARSAQQAQRARTAAEKERARLIREAERARKAAERERAADAKRAQQLYVESRVAQVAVENAGLAARVDALSTLLEWTLEVDDHIDLGRLRVRVEHPSFDPSPAGGPVVAPSWDRFAPPEPSGLSKLFGGKAKHEAAVAEATGRYHAAQQDAAHREGQRQQYLGQLKAGYDEQCRQREADAAARNAELDAFAARLAAADPAAIVDYLDLVLSNSVYPDDFPQHYKLAYVPESQQLVVEYELPSKDVVPSVREYRYVKTKDEVTSVARTMKDSKELYLGVVTQTTLRTLHEVFEADRAGWVQSIVFNGMVSTVDPATGQPVRPCLVSVRTTREVFTAIDLARVDPAACLTHLNASVSKKPDELAPIRPVLEFDMVDKRFIEETDVLSDLDQRPNLLDLTPSEFESLIQNLFTKMGLDTKQTRASRDGGIDCVAFDPRPIFGGKVVIQAKRYRNTVDVSAVRDLFGSMQNEGASKGILVTTSGYGPTSFEFASGKPIELIDGSNLLYLLRENAGIEARIVAEPR